jgi:hypothetical protein
MLCARQEGFTTMHEILPKPGSAEVLPQPGPSETSSSQAPSYGFAAAVIALAVAVSPATIALFTSLNTRLLAISLSFDLFLLLIAAASLARGRTRELLFKVIGWTIPLVLLATLETVAGAIHLADLIAPIFDFSTIKRGNDWGKGDDHRLPMKDGYIVYRPWKGRGVNINELGLRTALPTPKSTGEYRIAVSGGSSVWGAGLADEDTIPVQLQAALRRNGYNQVSVYNFGIEDATLDRELSLLRHFKDIYGIDQVVFISGGSDVFRQYFAIGGQPLEASTMGKRIASFALYRAIDRIRIWWGPSSIRLARIEQSLPDVPKSNRLTQGILDANDYCRANGLRCDFVLTPLLASRRTPVAGEVHLLRMAQNWWPKLDVLTAKMYRDAADLGLTGQVHDFTTVFDNNPEQVYIDGGHNNEAGNLAIVDALLPIVVPRLPSK